MHLQQNKKNRFAYKVLFIIILTLSISITPAVHAENSPPPRVAAPRDVTTTGGAFNMNQAIYVTGSEHSNAIYNDVAEMLRDLGATTSTTFSKAPARITFNRVPMIKGITGENALKITIKKRRITVLYTSDNSLRRATELLRSRIRTQNHPYSIPTGVIRDWGVQNAIRDRDATIDAASSFRHIAELETAIKKQSDKRVKELYIIVVNSENWRMQSPSLEVARAESFVGASPDASSAMSLYPADGHYTTEQLQRLVAACERLHITQIPTIELLDKNAPIEKCFGHSSLSVEGMRLIRAAIEDCAKAFHTKKICLGMRSAHADERYMKFIEDLFATLGYELVILKE